jgi:hypothetical protein
MGFSTHPSSCSTCQPPGLGILLCLTSHQLLFRSSITQPRLPWFLMARSQRWWCPRTRLPQFPSVAGWRGFPGVVAPNDGSGELCTGRTTSCLTYTPVWQSTELGMGGHISVYLDHRRCFVIHLLYALHEGVTEAVAVQDGQQLLMWYSIKCFFEIQGYDSQGLPCYFNKVYCLSHCHNGPEYCILRSCTILIRVQQFL